MRTNVSETSIDNYYGRVQGFAKSQCDRILELLDHRSDASIGEIAHELAMEKSSVSARVNALKKEGRLEIAAERRCSISGIRIQPVRLPREQRSLF